MKKVRSLAEFVGRIEAIHNKWNGGTEESAAAWYRGIPNQKYKLLPGLYRPTPEQDPDDPLEEENELRREFQLRGYPFLREALYHPQSRWDWYFLMQHFGVPTRLLDWTESALVALYFATGEARWQVRGNNKKSKADGIVWVLNPWKFNAHYRPEEERIPSFQDSALQPYLHEYFAHAAAPWPDSPFAFEPPHNSLRLAAQRGKFTIHGQRQEDLRTLQELEDILTPIVIDGRDRELIRQQLSRAGITESTLYPGMEGLSRDIHDYVGKDIVME